MKNYSTLVRATAVAALGILLLACSDDASGNPGSDAADGSTFDGAGDASGGDATDAADHGGDPSVDLGDDAPAPDVAVGDAESDVISDVAGDDVGGADQGQVDLAGDDASSDSGSDASSDSGSDASSDSGPDALSDASADASIDGDVVGDVACGARAGNTCTQAEYCDFPDGICGAADMPGVCRTRPEICTREYSPVCGCDGTVHSNECTAYFDGYDLNVMATCTAPEGWTECGSRFCLQELSFCRRTTPGMPDVPVSYECADLPESCGETPDCDCLSGEMCGGECSVQDDGGLLVTCLGA